MWHYNYSPLPDELYHYGVKGMKWKKRKGKSVWDKYADNASSLNRTGRISKRLSAGLYNASRQANAISNKATRRKNQTGPNSVANKINSAIAGGAKSVSKSLRNASVKKKKKANSSFHKATYWNKKVKSKKKLDQRYQQRRLKGER